MIIGSPRSGTTLVQRLASELKGVSVPPETHMLPWLDSMGHLHRPWPAFVQEQASIVEEYCSSPAMDGLELSPTRVVSAAGGTVSSPLQLLDAVLRVLAPHAAVLGEKTPNHLLWWRPLYHAQPDLRFIAVVREPRATVHSQHELLQAELPGVSAPLRVLAIQWAADQLLVEKLSRATDALVLRYEDVVSNVDSARARVAAHIGVQDVMAQVDARLILDREHWKRRALESVDVSRIERWRSEMEPSDARTIAAITRTVMQRFGYDDGGTGVAPPVEQAREFDERIRTVRARRMKRIEQTVLA